MSGAPDYAARATSAFQNRQTSSRGARLTAVRVVLRGEYFNDHDGYRTGVVQKWKEATLTVAYLPAKEWEIRAEVRADKSDQSAFLKSDGVTSTSTQRSFGLEALYKF